MDSAPGPSTLPSTPLRRISNPTRISTLQDTPWNKGSGSNSKFRSRNTQDDYKPYLREDLECSRVSITFDEFLEHILSVTPEWRLQNTPRIEKFVNSKQYQTMLQNYTSYTYRETERYHPFTKLVNHAMENFREQKGFVISFCRNDPIIVRGSYARRKPDGTGVESGVVNEGERGGVDYLSKGGPVGNAFFWTDLVSFLEFKSKEFNLSAFKTSPSKTIGLASYHAESSFAGPPPPPSSSKATQSRTQTQSTKRRSKATLVPSERITRSTDYSKRSSTKRVAPTEQHSDIPSQKRAKKRSEQHSDTLSQKRVNKSSEQPRAGASVDDLDLQCASYALELLSHGGLRNHVIAAAITDRNIQLLYYDRSIIVKSTPIDFIDDDSHFIAMLMRFASLTPLRWGYETLARAPHLSPRPPPLENGETISLGMLKGQTITLKNGKVLELGKTIYHQHGLIGRGTWVLRAELKKGNEQSESSDDDDAWNRGLIFKLSWSPKSRTSEDIIINHARSHAKALGDAWVLDHLPNVLHAEDIDHTSEEPIKGLMELLGDRYEPRVLRLLVQEELSPVTELVTAPDLARAFCDIFKCYKWLYLKAGIFHRDISINNMMYRKKDEKIFGVLNDYDLAIFMSNETPSSKTRTGTKPFMAIDLLGKPTDVHRYRHDLESLFYVIVYVTSRYDGGQEIDDPPLQNWEELGEIQLKSEKTAFLVNGLPTPTQAFRHFDILTEPMRESLLQGRMAHARHLRELRRVQLVGGSDPEFDLETMGGHVSFKDFGDIFVRVDQIK